MEKNKVFKNQQIET